MMSRLLVCIVMIYSLAGSLSADVYRLDHWSISARNLISTYHQCRRDHILLWPCIKRKAIKILERAIQTDEIPILDGVSITRDDGGKQNSPDDQHLSNDVNTSSRQLDDDLWSSLWGFLRTHSLKVKLPTSTELTVEGRGKLKKLAGPLLVALMFKALLAALALGALALLAGKALIVSKLAFALSLLLALKKLLGGGGTHHETYEIVAKHPHHHEGSSSSHVTSVAEPGTGYFGHRRSLLTASTPSITVFASSEPAYDVNESNYTTEDFAQLMAYRGQQEANYSKVEISPHKKV